MIPISYCPNEGKGATCSLIAKGAYPQVIGPVGRYSAFIQMRHILIQHKLQRMEGS